MEENMYKVLINGEIVASDMNIEIATTLVKALFEEYYNDFTIMTVSIKRENRAVCVDDDMSNNWIDDLEQLD